MDFPIRRIQARENIPFRTFFVAPILHAKGVHYRFGRGKSQKGGFLDFRIARYIIGVDLPTVHQIQQKLSPVSTHRGRELRRASQLGIGHHGLLYVRAVFANQEFLSRPGDDPEVVPPVFFDIGPTIVRYQGWSQVFVEVFEPQLGQL